MLRLIRYAELRKKGVPWSNTHISRLEKAGKFPKRIRLGVATSGWIEDEIDIFVANKFAEAERETEFPTAA